MRTFTQWCSPSWTLDQTTTNTDTYLTTTVYDMVGSVVPVPEPSSALVLGLGGIAFALYRWRLARTRGRSTKIH